MDFQTRDNIEQPVIQGEDIESNTQQEISEQEFFVDFIGKKKAEKYAKKFRKVEDRRISVNWAAFFFNAFWLSYRRMYKESILIMFVSFLLASISTATNKPVISAIGGIVFALGLLFGGNALYKSKYDWAAQQEDQEEVLEKHGGTRIRGIFLPIVGSIVYTIVVTIAVVILGAIGIL